EGQVRTYRVDRITVLDLLPTRADVPADLDAVAQLEHSLSQSWDYPTRVRFPRTTPERVRPWLPGTMGELVADGDDCLLLGTTSNPDMYAAEWLAQVQLPFAIEGGDELIDAMRRLIGTLRGSLPD
ncbi:MAG: WYL domain-containing protein, partial [Propionibacteriaceae bacterium]|nr:WYL domain-containing protein [Propionibacteriaceae bacterium]